MYAQPMHSKDLVDTRIAELRRTARPSRRPAAAGERRSSFDAPMPARRRAGWWLVALGLRLAVGSPHAAR